MMKKFLFCFAFVFGAMLIVSCNQPDEMEEISNNNESVVKKKTTLCGYIRDNKNGECIPYAKVCVKNEYTEYSDQEGWYMFIDIKEGTYYVEVTANGYSTEIVKIVVKAEEDYEFMDFYLTPKNNGGENGDNNGDENGDNNGDENGNNNGDENGNENYSEAEVKTDLPNLDVNLVSCKRKGNNVELTYTLTNTYEYGNMGITIKNVNSFTQKTIVSDNLGNQYSNKFVKISLAGKDWGYGNDIEGTLLPNVPSKCIITIKEVDNAAQYMYCYIYTSIALPGSVNYSDDVILKKIKIY